MPGKPLNLKRYGIGTARCRELQWFCLQYSEKKAELAGLIGVGSMRISSMPAYCGPSDPVSLAAIKRERLLKDCEDIEQAAIAATDGDSIMRDHLIRYVTNKDKGLLGSMPCGRRQFFEMQRRFFLLLHEKR